MVSTTIIYSIMMVAYFTSQDACKKWTDDTYGDTFGYACFELDGMHGQFYTMDFPTLEKCKEASQLFYGKNTCSKGYVYGMNPPLSRPEGLLGDRV